MAAVTAAVIDAVGWVAKPLVDRITASAVEQKLAVPVLCQVTGPALTV